MYPELPSKLLNAAVEELAKLPGVGRKTALRLALHLLKQPREDVAQFGNTFITLRNEIKHCAVCHTLSDADRCTVCSNPRRDHSTVCVVETIREMLSIENTQQYHGVYHVLGGIISPMDGVGPDDLTVTPLLQRAAAGNIREIILALSTTMEGETTCFYLYKKLRDLPIAITTIARGVGFGDDLEYTDELTLGRSIKNRQPFNSNFEG
ncbi:MAG: recombination mediator RecR [Prevotellaceae bacterium]|nr:recombination mediator RecR [Prevotellaceae bacterium]